MKHYQDVHGKSKKDRANHGGGGSDKKERKDYSREKKRGSVGQVSAASAMPREARTLN